MNRRTFFKHGIGTSLALGTYFTHGAFSNGYALPPLTYDLVAVKGGDPDVMFDKGIDALGGIGMFVRRGMSVVVKPNIGWDVGPERGGNTNPKLVGRIVEHCLHAGAKEVVVLDHSCDEAERCYRNSGIERAVRDAGGTMAPAHSEGYYHDVVIPGGKSLTAAKEHEAILKADAIINVPVLKCHSGTRLTIAMKNMMGNVWDRRFWHQNDLHQCIADFAGYRKPVLNVVDAYYVMKTNGPRGISTGDIVTMKAQLLSTDIVAVDTAAVRLFGMEPGEVRYLQLAAAAKIGRSDLDHLSIRRITV
ncbi:MAG TPA: DUF362 domain-containing protein [Bacteroidota bacterium]|nr:DUF362 domain-containing protein [Bacteroidota bacterium]